VGAAIEGHVRMWPTAVLSRPVAAIVVNILGTPVWPPEPWADAGYRHQPVAGALLPGERFDLVR
jgi:hypothetical protein